MTSTSKVVYGDRFHGTLEHLGGKRYHGTFKLPSGKFTSRFFEAVDRRHAIKDYQRWCTDQMHASGIIAQQFPPKEALDEMPELKDTTIGGRQLARQKEKQEAEEAAKALPDTVYIVMEKDGGPIRWTLDEDEALSAAALAEDTTKAMGFNTHMEVKAVPRIGA